MFAWSRPPWDFRSHLSRLGTSSLLRCPRDRRDADQRRRVRLGPAGVQHGAALRVAHACGHRWKSDAGPLELRGRRRDRASGRTERRRRRRARATVARRPRAGGWGTRRSSSALAKQLPIAANTTSSESPDPGAPSRSKPSCSIAQESAFSSARSQACSRPGGAASAKATIVWRGARVRRYHGSKPRVSSLATSGADWVRGAAPSQSPCGASPDSIAPESRTATSRGSWHQATTA